MKPSGLLWERGNLWFLILALPGLLAHKRAKWLFDHKHKTSCQTGTPMTPVLEGDPSVITCHFSEDLRLWKLDFGVIRHDLDGFDPLGDLILSCTWDLGKDNPSCIGKGSERVKLAASGNETTLDIPNTQKEHAGRYSCRYALSWPDDEGHCTLAVAGRSIFCSVPHATISVGAFSTITCHFHSDLLQTREKFHVYRFGEDGSQPVEVAYCTWNVRDANGKPSCVVRPGYHLDTGNIGTSATLEIGSAEEMHSGRYSCRTIPANENVTVIDCTLSVKVLKTTTTAATSTESGLPERIEDVADDHQTLSNVACHREEYLQKNQHACMPWMIPENMVRETAEILLHRVYSNKSQSLVSDLILHCIGDYCFDKKDGFALLHNDGKIITVTIGNFTEQLEGKYAITFKTNSHKETRMVCLHLWKGEADDSQGRSAAAKLQAPGLIPVVMCLLVACIIIFPLEVSFSHSTVSAPCRGGMA